MKTAVLAILLLLPAAAQNPLARPDAYVGTFSGDGVTLELTGSAGVYTGTEPQYQEYQRLRLQKELADERLDASRSWGPWGSGLWW